MNSEPPIHAARFGNRNGAHDVLQHTGADRAMLDSIKWFTDRPGTRWTEGSGRTYAGYAAQGHYVIQSTAPDHQAGRGGMVTTTALLIPCWLVAEIDLGLTLEATDALAGQDRMHSVEPMSLRRHQPCAHTRGVAALMDALAAAGVAVWLGPGHKEALACLWRHFGADDRLSLAFTATDHPDVAPLPRSGDSLRVLVAPEPLPAAFGGLPVVSTDSVTTGGPAVALFEPGRHPASLLASQLKLAKPTLRQWQHLITAELELQSARDGTMENTLAALALLGLLAPDPATGTAPKEEALNLLRGQIIGQAYGLARAIRTLPWDALPGPEGRRAITILWVRHAAENRDAASIAAALVELGERNTIWFPELHHQISHTLAEDLDLTVAVAAELVVRKDGKSALQAIVSDIRPGASPEFDRALYSSLDGRPTAEWAADEALRLGWESVHASLVDITDPTSAWRAHLPVSTDSSVALLAGRVAPSANVAAALVLADPELVRHAGRLAAANPDLLSPPQPTDAAYRQVWAAAVQCGMPASASCPLSEAAPLLLDAWLRGEEVDDVLLEAICADAGPILARHPNRAQLWTFPRTDVVSQLRAAVAARVARTLNVDQPLPEIQLAKEILAAQTLITLAREQPDQAVTVLETLSGTAEDQHGVLVAKNMTRTAPQTAYRLGSLTRARRWHDTARHLVTCGRADLQPAAQQAADILGFFDKLLLRRRTDGTPIPEPNASETFDAILDVLSDVYPEGPPAELWEQAGGRAADRPLSRTGRQAWREALTAITFGSAGTPSMPRLLAEACREHPRNQKLLALHNHTAHRNLWRSS